MKKKIHIPNPCAEDWNSMTPTEKGAYCDKCQLEVIDFTDMSSEEIKLTLAFNTGKRTCGHISRTQIDLVNTDYHVWENQSVAVLKSKFLYACLMVFGVGLFTGCGDTDNDHPVGDIEPIEEIIDGGMDIDDTISCDQSILEGEIEMGDMEAIDSEMPEE